MEWVGSDEFEGNPSSMSTAGDADFFLRVKRLYSDG
jgi:hypothetical protein